MREPRGPLTAEEEAILREHFGRLLSDEDMEGAIERYRRYRAGTGPKPVPYVHPFPGRVQ